MASARAAGSSFGPLVVGRDALLAEPVNVDPLTSIHLSGESRQSKVRSGERKSPSFGRLTRRLCRPSLDVLRQRTRVTIGRAF